MATGQMRVSESRRANVASRVATQVKDALKKESMIEAGAVGLSARIAGTAAAAVAELPPEARRQLTRHEPELMTRIRSLVHALGEGVKEARLEIAIPRNVESRKGSGLGEIVSAEEGLHALGKYAVTRRLEDWAGPIAGATELARDYGIARSTLHHWQQSGAVIGLLKGTKKHVFPVDQFVDGRPVRGLAEINDIVADPRVAWIWLSRANPILGGRRPIDLLKRDRVDEVIEAACDYFGPACG